MPFTPHASDASFAEWLASDPTEDELRDAYVTLEQKRRDLWTPGTLDSFRRDRYEVDATCVRRLVEIKWALVQTWEHSGQFRGRGTSPSVVTAVPA